MKIHLKKPFWTNLENEGYYEQEEQLEQEEQEYHPEYEEKPVVEATALTSEEVHGGEEQSDSGEGNKPSQSDKGTPSDGNEDEQSEQGNEEESQNKNGSEQENAEGQGSSEEATGETSAEDKENAEGQGSSGNSSSSEPSEKTETPEDGEETSEDEDEEVEEEDGTTIGGQVSTKKNYRKIVELKRAEDRRLRTAFQRWLEKIAELETKVEIPGKPERLSMRQIMKRVLDQRPLNNCYVQRLKETVILLVDTSGSMDWWAEILQTMTTIALKLKDIEIYECPNGLVTRSLTSFDTDYYDWYLYQGYHRKFMEKTKNRTIIYIGDFDGGDTPYYLAKSNKVYWLCNEQRYDDTLDHNWCHYSLSEYPKNCKFYRVYEREELIKVFRGGKS